MDKYSYPDYDGTQNCFGKNTEHFYIDDREKGQTKKNKKLLMDAKIMCSTCPFLDQCRMYALKREKYGVWGGTTPQERDKLRKVLGITLEPYNHGSSLRKLILEGE
jgi:WhiB family redox-sensing transcriptional regulator